MSLSRPDLPTLLAISALSYVLAVALHEHAGHAAACVLLGSHVTVQGAFFVECDLPRLASASQRAVELAGPLVSLLSGGASLLLLRLVPPGAARAGYFFWLLGSLGLMSAAGYPLFSGITGLGDLGTTGDGALWGARPEWLWRLLLTTIGVLGYRSVVRLSARLITLRLPDDAPARVDAGARMMRISYFTGAAVYAAIGLLKPHGALIMLESVLPSSLGGTSGLIWMRPWLGRVAAQPGARLDITRSVAWIAAGAAAVITYAWAFGAR